jgi:membrane protease YdiL (CAAX protease family)
MTKYIKMIGNILLYTLIYFFLQLAAGLTMGVGYTIKYIGILTELEIQDKLNHDIYFGIAAAAICSIAIYVLILRKKDETFLKKCKFQKEGLQKSPYVVLASIGLAAVSSSFVLLSYEKFESYEEVSQNINAGLSTLLGAMCIIILIPIFEEILFRGLVQNELMKQLPIPGAIVIQAAVFALYHGNPLQGIYTFVLGIALGAIYLWSNNLWLPILLHVTYNFLGTLIFPVLLYYTESYAGAYMAGGVILFILAMIFLYKKRELSLSIEVPAE